MSETPNGFWQERTLNELAAEQGISIPQSFDTLLGAGRELWESDECCELFVSSIYERRRGVSRE